MRFALLGPLVLVRDADDQVEVGGARLRVLLATLLLHAGRPVSLDALSEAVWDGTPPPGAATTLRGHVLRLRRALGREAGARIAVRDPGYLIRVADAEVDVREFEALCRNAGAAVRDHAWADASAVAARALGLWRGTPLADVPSQALRDAWVPHLERTRVQALEWRIEADLRTGRGGQLVSELRRLVGDHPLRERFHAQLMLALAGTGRQAEALAAYQDARRLLVGQLGIEPGPELHQLHERILAGEAGLPEPPRSESASRPARVYVPPRQLPAGRGHFVGRAGELTVLSEVLSRNAAASGAVAIAVICGTAGIGKTALAVHWAHQHADQFPDGQLYVNLRGFDASGAPMEPADAVRRFLDALGVPAGLIPADLDEQAALYRTQFADRRVMIVLDNARGSEQVRPLLPGSPGCLVLVTSRNRLGSLIALEGAVPVTLDLLTDGEARDLLTRRLGGEALAADRHVVDDLIHACARLPLALNIAAIRAALHPTRALAAVVEDLRDARRRLDTLTVGDAAVDVRAVLSCSYQALAPESARMFRLLGLHPGPDISLPAASALAAVDLSQAHRLLDDLTTAHLITEHVVGRYAFHDLLRAYATEQANTHDSQAERLDALRRVRDFYALVPEHT